MLLKVLFFVFVYVLGGVGWGGGVWFLDVFWCNNQVDQSHWSCYHCLRVSGDEEVVEVDDNDDDVDDDDYDDDDDDDDNDCS